MFYQCSNLKNAEIKGDALGSWTFSGCTSLADVKLCESLKAINKQAF